MGKQRMQVQALGVASPIENAGGVDRLRGSRPGCKAARMRGCAKTADAVTMTCPALLSGDTRSTTCDKLAAHVSISVVRQLSVCMSRLLRCCPDRMTLLSNYLELCHARVRSSRHAAWRMIGRSCLGMVTDGAANQQTTIRTYTTPNYMLIATIHCLANSAQSLIGTTTTRIVSLS